MDHDRRRLGGKPLANEANNDLKGDAQCHVEHQLPAVARVLASLAVPQIGVPLLLMPSVSRPPLLLKPAVALALVFVSLSGFFSKKHVERDRPAAPL